MAEMATPTYAALRNELRRTLLQERKWTEMPRLLNDMDQLRCNTTSGAGLRLRHKALWVDRFAEISRCAAPPTRVGNGLVSPVPSP